MIKEITIYTESFISDVTDCKNSESEERTSAQNRGTARIDESSITLSYTEEQEGVKISTKICVFDGAVIVKKRGGAEYDFEFSEEKTTASVYKIPPYSFDAEIQTEKIINNLTADGGELTLIYTVTIGGAKRKTRMNIRVTQNDRHRA